MSHQLINHNSNLEKLRNEGYEVEICNGYLLIHNVPFVNGDKKIDYGTLVSTLTLSGEKITTPDNHVVQWVGDYPCDSKGAKLIKLDAGSINTLICKNLIAKHTFSQKPPEGYANYYEKMTQYIKIIENEAHAINPSVTAKTFPVISDIEEKSVFHYIDTASSRAGINHINEKLKINRIAIIGLGGTGSYILDLVAKTPVNEIHLFDGDGFLQHNAFRSPGAPSLNDLQKKMSKVEWFEKNYSKMRKNIIPHFGYIDESNIAELKSMNTVFICIDDGESRSIIINYLIENNIPLIDVGIGLNIVDEMLTGLVRITTCTPSFNEHMTTRIPFGNTKDNEYSNNIQIVDINALNAALAVIKWKKMLEFYYDSKHEHNTTYGIDTNELTSNEMSDETKSF